MTYEEKKQSIMTIWGNGEIFSKDLKIVQDEITGEEKYIKGTIGIQVRDKEVVRFDVFQSAKNTKGNDNFKFTAFKTVMDEYEKGNKVFIGVNKKFPNFPNAEIKIDVYEDSGKVVTKVKDVLNLINRAKDDSDFENSIKFKISDFVVESIEEEYDEVSATGRGILKGRVIDYNGVAKPIELILTKEGFEYAKQTWKEDDVVDISGLVINKAIEVKAETSSGFGQVAGSKPSYTYIKEYLVDAGSEKKYDSFTQEEIEAAKSEYDDIVSALLGEDEDVPF